MELIPFRFGRPDRRMFGAYHPSDTRTPTHAVLLCNPFGQAGIRSHRMYRVFAERLARAGVPALRFDYYATGDSAGDDREGNLSGWADDVLTASAELARRSRAPRLLWMGARLGATIVARAATRGSPDTIVLWEPVLDGPAFLDAFSTRRQGRPVEAIGFALSDVLVDELQQLRVPAFAVPRARSVIVASGSDAGAVQLISHWRAAGSEATLAEFEHQFDWTAEEADNTPIVPTAALARVLPLLTSLPA